MRNNAKPTGCTAKLRICLDGNNSLPAKVKFPTEVGFEHASLSLQILRDHESEILVARGAEN